MAEITNLTANGKLSEDWQTINNNFENLNTGKAEASTTYTKTEVDTAVSGKVSKSGDTMSGLLTIHLGEIANGETPTGGIYANHLIFRTKKDNSVTCEFQRTYETSGRNYLRIVNHDIRNTTKTTELRVGFDSQGNAFTYCPTPTTTDNSGQIATTAFVNNACLTVTSASVPANITVTANSSTVKKAGKCVTCNISATIGQDTSNWTTILTIPEGYRPIITNNFYLYDYKTSQFRSIRVATTGTIQFVGGGGVITSGTEFFGTFSYITN